MKHMPTPELLLSTAKLYRSLSQNNYRITLTDDSVIELRFPAGCYHHLVGLHKFPDIAEVTIDRERGRSAKSIYQDILCGNITEYDLQLSEHYDEAVVPDRLRAFLNIDALLNQEASLVLPYRPDRLLFNTRIRGDLLLFRAAIRLKTGTQYMLLFFRRDSVGDYYVPISFFEHLGSDYLKNQVLQPIKAFRVERKRTKR